VISAKECPIKRLIEAIVLVGFVTACLLQDPTLISPPSTKAMIDGVVLLPSALGITTASLPYITETQELVVPNQFRLFYPFYLYLIIVYTYFNNSFPSQSLCQYKRVL
jgi:hypothetical protein